MRYFAGFIIPLLFSGNLFAQNLCDASCDLSITFPDGGSIEAVAPLTITFGSGNVINDGAGTMSYAAGEQLQLAAGESIAFQANGSFDLGSGGNIDYTDILILSNGVMDLSAVEGSNKVMIYTMTLLGGCSLDIASDFEVVESGMFHIFSGPVTASTDLSFTNHGSVSGSFQFQSATLTLEDEVYEITGSVLIEADGQLTMTSEEVVIAQAQTVSGGGSVEGGAGDDTTSNAASDSTVAAAGSGSGGASGGSFNIFGLLVYVILLFAVRRRYAFNE